MSVLVMETHLDLSDHHDFLQKLGTFAGNRGWTVNDNLQNVQWVITSGFIAGNEGYLEIESNGYGSQTLHFRFRTEATGSDPDNEWLQMGAFKAGATSKDTGSATHPVQRANPGGVANWNTNRFFSMKPSTIPKVWFFGDDKFIVAVVQFDSNYVQFLSFGSLEVFDTTEAEGNYAGYINITTADTAKWYNKNNLSPFDKDGDHILYEVAKVSATNEFCTIRFSSNNSPVGEFFKYGKAIAKNAYATRRPALKPLIYIKKGNGRTFPIGRYPIFRIDVTDYAIGEVIDYGTMQLVCFPNGTLNDRVKGVGIQISS